MAFRLKAYRADEAMATLQMTCETEAEAEAEAKELRDQGLEVKISAIEQGTDGNDRLTEAPH